MFHTDRDSKISNSTSTSDVAGNANLAEHLSLLEDAWRSALARFGFDGAWLTAGEADVYFQDDHGPKFKPNPYLSQWVDPAYISPGTRLLIQPGKQPTLFLHAPADYWHAAPPLPDELAPYLDIRTFAEPKDLLHACQQAVRSRQRLALIGPEQGGNEELGEPNPTGLVNYLHFHRARKNAYELAAMRQASAIGVAGHRAAEEAFHGGGTEFEIHMAYLAASQQAEIGLPYGNIVAMNSHASILHYQYQDRVHHEPTRSLLIDAGGNHRGYASDITRTHAARGEQHTAFAELVTRMEDHQQELIAGIRPGRTFADLHVQMHQQLGRVLSDANLLNCSADAAFELGITERFCPHGLGHLLGLQVHDVGGHLADETGVEAPPPANYPSLRFTREIEPDQVFTIEPGLYFIPSLLAELRKHEAPVNWRTVDLLSPYGGIRIEDNVRVLPDGVENLTRDAFASLLNA